MSYSPKTYKKCTFVKLAKNALKPLKKYSKDRERFKEDKSKIISEWRDGWFKGKYECPENLL